MARATGVPKKFDVEEVEQWSEEEYFCGGWILYKGKNITFKGNYFVAMMWSPNVAITWAGRKFSVHAVDEDW